MTVGELKQMLRDEPDGKMVMLIYSNGEWVDHCTYLEASGCGANFRFFSDELTAAKAREMMCCKTLPAVSLTSAAITPALPAPESTGLAVIDSLGNPGAVIRR
jgi:hypothetical protein